MLLDHHIIRQYIAVMKFLLITAIFFLAGCAASDNDKLIQIRNYQAEVHESCDRIYPDDKDLVKVTQCNKDRVGIYSNSLGFKDTDILMESYNKSVILTEQLVNKEISDDRFIASMELVQLEENRKLNERAAARAEVDRKFYQALGEMGQAMQPPASTYQKPVNCYSTSIYNDSFSCY